MRAEGAFLKSERERFFKWCFSRTASSKVYEQSLICKLIKEERSLLEDDQASIGRPMEVLAALRYCHFSYIALHYQFYFPGRERSLVAKKESVFSEKYSAIGNEMGNDVFCLGEKMENCNTHEVSKSRASRGQMKIQEKNSTSNEYGCNRRRREYRVK